MSIKTGEILDLAIEVMKNEIEKINDMSGKTDIVLSPEDISSLTNIAKTLLAVDKNAKNENQDDDEFKNLSDDQLKIAVKEILEKGNKKR